MMPQVRQGRSEQPRSALLVFPFPELRPSVPSLRCGHTLLGIDRGDTSRLVPYLNSAPNPASGVSSASYVLAQSPHRNHHAPNGRRRFATYVQRRSLPGHAVRRHARCVHAPLCHVPSTVNSLSSLPELLEMLHRSQNHPALGDQIPPRAQRQFQGPGPVADSVVPRPPRTRRVQLWPEREAREARAQHAQTPT